VYDVFECIVFHMTDLPFGRGGSPLQNLIVRGIEITQLTALRCVERLDAGPVYLKRPLSTLGSAEEVLLRAAALIEEMIVEIADRAPQPLPQTGETVVFERRTPAQGDLSGAKSLTQVHDLIRMLDADGYPPAFIDIGSLRLEFSHASLRAGHVEAHVRITVRNGTEST
jgi:methionyl-tRNA formyltransferase